MKKICVLITLQIAVCILSIQAQTLYGTTFHGGDNGGGTINKFIPATNNLIVVKSFESVPANPGNTSFIQASDGKLYGMTFNGGKFYGYSKGGAIFSFDPSSSTYTKLKDFSGIDGAGPAGSLIQASDGKLYGMTLYGGRSSTGGFQSGLGVIFSVDPSSGTYTKLIDFDRTNGAYPNGSLIQASDGKLYGMTSSGGTSNGGVIFSFDPSSSTYTKLRDFDGTDGAHPQGSFIQASDGKLYGMTAHGIFSYDPTTSTITKLKDFGGNIQGNLIQAADGKLYGMTPQGGSRGGGVIFSFDPFSSTYTKLRDLDYTNGAYPYGSLIQAGDGKLYGMTSEGGSIKGGVIFSYDPSSSTYTKLKDFDHTNGAYPYGSLMQASDGKLYGMTYRGARSDNGVIFSFDPPSSTYTSLKDLGTNESGSNVTASLIRASDGKLYGMTNGGGSSGVGVIFSYDPAASTYTKLKDFDYTNGARPFGSLIQASDGKLYGMTSGGGSRNRGVIFSFDPTSSTYKKLKNIDGTNGTRPFGNLIQGSDGKLYGMTNGGVGGQYGRGVIFSYDPSSSTYTKLKDLEHPDAVDPYGSLMQARDGKLYGMAFNVIFSYDPSSSTYTTLKNFDGTNGADPMGSNLMQASDGKLYGMTYRGGSNGCGVIFSYDPSSSTYINLKDFDTTGYGLKGSLMQASDGKLYGRTYEGGSSNLGIIFSFDPLSSTYTKLQDYNGANGANGGLPIHHGSAFIEVRDVENKPPSVTLTIPYNIVKYTGPARIKLNAIATDEDGTISKVRFYNGATLLHTETVFPYGFLWDNVPVGNYTLTAKATDNDGNVTTSKSINVSVVDENVPPVVSIISPVDKATYTGPATIHLIAKAKDPNDKITKVEFYNGTTLIITKHHYPYSYTWRNVQPGTYTLTAKAFDDKGLSATSDPVTVTVTEPNVTLLSSKSLVSSKTDLNGVSLKLSPNPARNSLSIYTNGLQQNKKLTISVVSVSGVVIKTIQATSKQLMQMDVSSLRPGVYFFKIVCGDKVLSTRFVKL